MPLPLGRLAEGKSQTTITATMECRVGFKGVKGMSDREKSCLELLRKRGDKRKWERTTFPMVLVGQGNKAAGSRRQESPGRGPIQEGFLPL